jgi:hypothetical protein
MASQRWWMVPASTSLEHDLQILPFLITDIRVSTLLQPVDFLVLYRSIIQTTSQLSAQHSYCMEQRTGNFARPQSIRRQHAIKGVLHMIDKTGGVEMTTEDQNKIIANHLLQDKYEYEQKTGGRPQRYNVQQIRKLMAKLVHESKLKSTRGAEDSVTLLFHRQSQALDPTILAKCGYRRHEPLAALQQRSLQLFKDHTATPSKTANFDASRRSSPIPDVLQIAPASVSLSSPLFGDEIVLSTPSQKFHESASTQSVSSRLYSRNLKRKTSADPSPQAFNQSPTVLVPRDERSDTIRHAARGLRAGTKRLFSRSQHLSPIDAVGEIQAIKDIQETQLLWMIGHLKLTQCSCPVTPQPGRELIPLYKRCWGDDWKRGGNELLMSGRRGVIGDTTALISAFLFESILTGSAPLARYTEHGAEDNGMCNI